MAKKKSVRKRVVKETPVVDPCIALRAQFKAYMDNACYCAYKEVWLKAVHDLAHKRYGKNPTPQQWVEAAKDAVTPCDTCKGTGRWEGGAQVNGRMTKSGPCYRCEAKGHFTQDDNHRNRCYDNHRKVI